MNQSKKIILSDRKVLFNQFIDYHGTTIQFLFKWPIFENHLNNYDKEFFPKIKRIFNDLLLVEDHWQQIIIRLSNNKEMDVHKKDIIKELEKFLSLISEDDLRNLYSTMISILRNRIELLTSSEPLSPEKMKQLLI